MLCMHRLHAALIEVAVGLWWRDEGMSACDVRGLILKADWYWWLCWLLSFMSPIFGEMFCVHAFFSCVFVVEGLMCDSFCLCWWDVHRGFPCAVETCRHSRWGWKKCVWVREGEKAGGRERGAEQIFGLHIMDFLGGVIFNHIVSYIS